MYIKKRIISLILTTTLIIGLCACGAKEQKESTKKSDDTLSNKFIETEITNEQTKTTNIDDIKKLSDIQWNLIRDDENVNFSPISFKYAMLLLQRGANNETSEKISAFLENDNKNYLKESNEIMKTLEKTDVVKMANAIFAEEDVVFDKEYIKDTKKYIDAEIVNIDFNNPKSQEIVNKWVSKNTNNLIKNFPINTDARTLLMNAIYFKDKWDYFEEDATYECDFNSIDCVQSIETMHTGIDDIDVYFGNCYAALELQMENSKLKIFLPDEGKTVSEIANILSQNEGNEKKYTYDTVYVSLPKFKFEGEKKLVDFVKESGLSELFDDNLDTFERMSPGESLKVSDILQKSTIEFSEKGVEASAVTGITMETCALEELPEKTYDFNVNRPFLYSVESNGEELFIGAIVKIPE